MVFGVSIASLLYQVNEGRANRGRLCFSTSGPEPDYADPIKPKRGVDTKTKTGTA
jgi:hypothetical protein